MKTGDDLTFKLCVAGLAAVALFAGTTSFAQHLPLPEVPAGARLITDPAEVAAILAKCGIKRTVPGGQVQAPPGQGQGVQVRGVRCNIPKENGQIRTGK